LEATPAALALTRAEADRRGGPALSYAVGDVHALDFPDSTFDVVHAHQVLQHVADPVKALAEMRRVCRPDGLVAARDSDYAGFTWFPLLPELDEWLALYHRIARANGGEPDAGRRLLSWARAAGFTDIDVSASTWRVRCLAQHGHAFDDRVDREVVQPVVEAVIARERRCRRARRQQRVDDAVGDRRELEGHERQPTEEDPSCCAYMVLSRPGSQQSTRTNSDHSASEPGSFGYVSASRTRSRRANATRRNPASASMPMAPASSTSAHSRSPTVRPLLSSPLLGAPSAGASLVRSMPALAARDWILAASDSAGCASAIPSIAPRPARSSRLICS